MLRVPIIELFLRLIPEGFLFMFASYAFSKRVIIKNRYIFSSLMLGVAGYIIRLFPINFGVHSVLSIIAMVVITVNINKIDIVKAISAAVIVMILGFVSEGVNVFIIQNIVKANISEIFEDPIMKSLYGMPSLLILGVILGAYYSILLKRNELKDVPDRKGF